MSTDLAIPEDDDLLGFGLEDFGTEDMTMPRLQIVGAEGVYKDSLSGETFEKVEVIVLGLIKSRVLWPPEMGDTPSAPLCRSNDAKIGRTGKDFPHDKLGLTVAPEQGTPIECAKCPLQVWGSHPTRETPWCAEQYSFAIMMKDSDTGVWFPATVTFQGSGVKPVKNYLSSFKRSQKPMFVHTTIMTLEQRKRGTVKYSVPIFKPGTSTPADQIELYKLTYRRIRSFLQQEDAYADDTAAGEEVVVVGGAAVLSDDDEVPF